MLLRAPILQINRETPESLLSRGPLLWSAANGALLGLAVTSRIGFWLWYMIPIGVFLSASPIAGAVIWGSYGLVRLGVLGIIAARMRRSEAAPHRITSDLLMAAARVRMSMTVVALIASFATIVRVGL